MRGEGVEYRPKDCDKFVSSSAKVNSGVICESHRTRDGFTIPLAAPMAGISLRSQLDAGPETI